MESNIVGQPSSQSPPTACGRIDSAPGHRYLFVLLAVAGLVVVDQVIVQPMLVRLSWYAPVINVAGRQRMLSQRLDQSRFESTGRGR